MPKKIYDIVPPKTAPKEESEKFPVAVKVSTRRNRTPAPDPVLQPQIEPQVLYKRQRRFPLREVFVGGFIMVFLAGFYYAGKLAKADVEIWPTLGELEFQERLTADITATAVDLDHKIIPAQYVEEIQENWQQFDATGSSSNDVKAQGTIRIYNKISPATSFALKVGTHFLSDSGKYFLTLEKVTIPAASKNQPGSVEVKVQAQDAGGDYNIKSSKFSVPKLSGTAYYYSIFAESKEDMVGGSIGKVTRVSEDDLENAKSSLTRTLLDQAQQSLQKKLSEDDVLVQGAISKDIVSASSDVKANAVIDKFNQSAKVRVSALVFKKSDLSKVINHEIQSQIKEDQSFLEDKVDIEYSPQLIDMKAGKETLDLRVATKIYNKIDVSYLAGVMGRKSAEEIKSLIDGKYGSEISGVKINLWPFWVKKTPADRSKINVQLNF